MVSFSHFIEAKEKFDTTLAYHDTLNSKIWDDHDTLRSDVHQALIRIAHDWADFSRISFSAIKDIVITGGNCNYNYTNASDIDIHLIVDLGKVIKDLDIVEDWLYDKKVLWAVHHPHIRVKGYPVELYAEDHKSEIPKSDQGVYSLIHEKWISKPSKRDVQSSYDDPHMIRKIKYYMKQIDGLTSDISFSTKKKIEQIKSLKRRFYKMRSSGIQKSGEFALENLVFKSLRNLGKIDKLNDFLAHAEDKEYSLD